MKIAILTLGTRGDVQPYAVLGQTLQQHGHRVVVSTARNFESLIRSYGLEFVSVDADFQALLNSDEGKQMMKNPFRAQKNFSKWVHPMIYSALSTFYRLAKESDRVLFHGKTLAGYFADQFPKKMIRANVIPAFEPTSEFVNPVFSGLHLPNLFNRFTFTLTELSYQMMHAPIKQFRKANRLPLPVRNYKGLPSLYGISSLLLPKPIDYPANSHFTGFWYNTSSATLADDVVRFLQEGPAPLLLTFGSMPLPTNLDIQQAVLKVAEELKCKIIVIRGWGFENTSLLEQHPAFKIIESAPYDKLLPYVKAVIHHGGIGTVAECLRAGRPFLSCPVMYPLGDQHFWGQLAYQKGVALKPVPLKKVTESLLLAQVKKLLETEQLYEKSQQLANQLKTENGPLNAVQFIESLSRED